MKKRSAALFALIAAGLTLAQEPVTLSGTVITASSQPIVGAIVTVKNMPELTAVTDATGTFAISTVAVRQPLRQSSGVSYGAVLSGNNLYIAGAAGVAMKLYTAAGQLVASRTIEKLGAAEHSWTLPRMAEGMYLLSVTSGGKVSTFKQFFASRQTLSVSQRDITPVKTAKTEAFSSDSLVVAAAGYAPAYLNLTSYVASGLQLLLFRPTAQWQPTAALEHVGNMVKVTAKDMSFAMGQPVVVKDDDGLWSFEQPVHTVTFSYNFLMDTTEIPQKMYKEIMAGVPGFAQATGWNTTYGIGDNIAAHHSGISDAMLFCNARSKLETLDTVYSYTSIEGTPGRMCTLKDVTVDCTKKGYRLPTEAEWEYACRGGSFTDFYWNKNYRPYPATAADTAEISANALWYANAGSYVNDDPHYGLKQGVASKLPNKYGLYDMIGGCMEWVHLTYFTYGDDKTDPKPSGAVVVEGNNTSVSPRGGNFDNKPINLRSASRKPVVGNYPYCYWGFRTVKEVE